MDAYVVTFSNRLCDSIGVERKVCQRRLVIRRAGSPERAVETAKRDFAAAEGIVDWTLRAHTIDVEKVPEGGCSA